MSNKLIPIQMMLTPDEKLALKYVSKAEGLTMTELLCRAFIECYPKMKK